MRQDSTRALLITSDLQMMPKRGMIDAQVPGSPTKSLIPDSGLKVLKRNCPKLGAGGV